MVANEIHPGAIHSLLNADHGSPFELLGPHPVDINAVSIRAFWPTAQEMTVIDADSGARYPMHRLHDEGLFEVTVPATWPGLHYHYEIVTIERQHETAADPYAFSPWLTDYELYLWNQGRYLYSYDKLGAHLRTVDGVTGVNFAVWAPNAYRVSVIGDFNRWDPRVHPMRLRGETGVWELFIPGLQEGAVYRYDLRSRVGGYHAQHSDPYGFYAEVRPNNASVVANTDDYAWGDQVWVEQRDPQRRLNKPMAIYEVHLGSWRLKPDGSWLTYRELADELVGYAREMGFTHLELMPIAEHPLDMSWGYQTTGYYAPTSRYGSPTDFMYFVDRCHQAGIGVILDWVPAHFPKDGYALSYFDGTHLYEHANPQQAEHPDWGTYIFNYGRNEVRNFLLSNALYWLQRYHIDGLRVDAVSSMLYLDFSRKAGEWVPNQYGGRENLEAIAFLKEANAMIHSEVAGAMSIAEESTAWPMVSHPTYLGGLGFTFKWNMGWMHDTLEYMHTDPLYRRYAHYRLTFSMVYAFNENFILSLSHDEVVHAKGSLINKMPGDWWQRFASLRLLFGYQYMHPGKKLNFMGQEFGQWREWGEQRGLDWDLLEWPAHVQLQTWMHDLNHFYVSEPALYEHDFDSQGFQWIEANDVEQSVYSYIRRADDPDNLLVVVCNLTPMPRYQYRIGVPKAGYYAEVLNSDSSYYGGGNIGNNGGVETDPIPWHAWAQSLSLTIPPLAIVVLKPGGAS